MYVVCVCVSDVFVTVLFHHVCRRRYDHVQDIREGQCLQTKTVLYTYSSGSSCGSLYFIWTVPKDESESDLLMESQAVAQKVKNTFPSHTCNAQAVCS